MEEFSFSSKTFFKFATLMPTNNRIQIRTQITGTYNLSLHENTKSRCSTKKVKDKF